MYLLMGGSGSTGSSLLRQRLNRHSQIYITNEWHLFCKPSLYQDWNKNKSKLFRRWIFGLRSSGIKQFTGLDTENVKEQRDILDALNASSFKAFCDSLYGQYQKNQDEAFIWGDKTPANSYHFQDFINTFPEAKCILTIRNPLDSIASMHRRGISVFLSTAIYLLNTAHGLSMDPHKQLLKLKYEALIEEPTRVLQQMCTFLKVPYEAAMLMESKADTQKITKLDSWAFDESTRIQNAEVSSFDRLSGLQKKSVLNAIYSIQIKNSWKEKHQLRHTNIPEIADYLQYSIPSFTPIKSKELIREKNIDQWNHSLKAYPINHLNYPIEIHG